MAVPGSIVCVSNSFRLQGAKLGETIDAFDEVVRFNEFQTAGFEEDVGTRTTCWIHSDIVPRRHYTRACREILAVPNHKREMLSIDSELETIPRSVEAAVRAQYSFNDNTWPTTGLLGLAYLLLSYETVGVCGWLTTVDAHTFKRHYYNDPNEVSPARQRRSKTSRWIRRVTGRERRRRDTPVIWHDLLTEKRVYESWCKSGQVIPIDSHERGQQV